MDVDHIVSSILDVSLLIAMGAHKEQDPPSRDRADFLLKGGYHFSMLDSLVVSSDPILVIHLYYKGMNMAGTPPGNLFSHLRPYFGDFGLDSLELKFDFGTNHKAVQHGKMIASLQKKICSVPAGWVLLFVSTHSNEERSDLFTQQQGPTGKSVAVKVEMLFDLLLGNCMDNVIRGAIIVLLTCGWAIKYKESFKGLQLSLKCLQVSHCLAFTAI
ncbi:hypothetical protein BDN67DRAFT_984975 [Paxillus ammoniavirescens]|nr:hypothetical protein BDN67DRAFT_984975 [Paxillus ammoniavirescens]